MSWRAGALVVLLLCGACMSAGLSFEQPPPERHLRVPDPFEGEVAPELVTTEEAGLFHVPDVDEHLYYWKPQDLWYHWAFNRWYQAFRWNGYWFPPAETPEVLLDRVEPEAPPTLPEYENLPTLPEYENPQS